MCVQINKYNINSALHSSQCATHRPVSLKFWSVCEVLSTYYNGSPAQNCDNMQLRATSDDSNSNHAACHLFCGMLSSKCTDNAVKVLACADGVNQM